MTQKDVIIERLEQEMAKVKREQDDKIQNMVLRAEQRILETELKNAKTQPPISRNFKMPEFRETACF